MKNKFIFYEVVTVVDKEDCCVESVYGEEGVILGMVKDNDSHKWIYAVSILDTSEVWNLDEAQLESTGKHLKRSDVYCNESVKVKVDPKTGRGDLVE